MYDTRKEVLYINKSNFRFHSQANGNRKKREVNNLKRQRQKPAKTDEFFFRSFIILLSAVNI